MLLPGFLGFDLIPTCFELVKLNYFLAVVLPVQASFVHLYIVVHFDFCYYD
jgi:hypothetical protein